MSKKDKKVVEELKQKGYSEEFAMTVVKKGKTKWYKKAWNWMKENSYLVIGGAVFTGYTAFLIACYIWAKKEADANEQWFNDHIDFYGVDIDGENRLAIIAKDMREHIGDIGSEVAKMVSKIDKDTIVTGSKLTMEEIMESDAFCR